MLAQMVQVSHLMYIGYTSTYQRQHGIALRDEKSDLARASGAYDPLRRHVTWGSDDETHHE